jgi:hypothetical protein
MTRAFYIWRELMAGECTLPVHYLRWLAAQWELFMDDEGIALGVYMPLHGNRPAYRQQFDEWISARFWAEINQTNRKD